MKTWMPCHGLELMVYLIIWLSSILNVNDRYHLLDNVIFEYTLVQLIENIQSEAFKDITVREVNPERVYRLKSSVLVCLQF